MIGLGTNALASAIFVVGRERPTDARIASRREFLDSLRTELPSAVGYLQSVNIAPVDLAQAAIGPGMAVYTKYAKVLDAAGNAITVHDALSLINEILDEVLTSQEGDFDSDTRWALSWFEQYGFSAGDFGVAETLSKAKNTSVGGIVDAGIGSSKAGKVRLLKPEELADGWTPETDKRLTIWEVVHQLIRALNHGEAAAADLVSRLGSKAEIARELTYRLYSICERRKRAQEAISYNTLVQSWPEILHLSRQTPVAAQTGLFQES
jgi:putative DNA methylase